MDSKAARTIQLCLVDEIIYNVMDEETITGLWSILDILYMIKYLSNKLCIKKLIIIWATHEGRDNGIGAFKLL